MTFEVGDHVRFKDKTTIQPMILELFPGYRGGSYRVAWWISDDRYEAVVCDAELEAIP